MTAAAKAKPAPLAVGDEVIDFDWYTLTGQRLVGKVVELVNIGGPHAVVRGVEAAGDAREQPSCAWLLCDSVQRFRRASEVA